MMLRLITLLTGLGILCACTTSPTGRSQLVLMPDSQMNQMGLQAFTSIKKETPVDKSPKANAYVQCVSNEITREVGGSWEVAVFKDDSANAFALPGNKIGVYTGLLQVAKNQHQLATVIGHEVAHVLSHHSNERVSQKFAVEQSLSLVNAVANPTSGTGRTVMGLLGVGTQFGILMPFTRVQESEADLYGLKLMARAGFDPRESVNLWINMGKTNKGQPPEFLSTHPSGSTRITDLRRNMDAAMRIYQQAQNAGKRPACS
ncbi:MAG: M48 family metallopeptidase [Gammaproteobacteria bacterium]